VVGVAIVAGESGLERVTSGRILSGHPGPFPERDQARPILPPRSWPNRLRMLVPVGGNGPPERTGERSWKTMGLARTR
jgi:hypothetical protein